MGPTAVETGRSFLPLFLIFALTFVSCSGNFEHVRLDSREAKAYVDDLMTSRLQKDVFFRTNLASPLTPGQKVMFQHLSYFSPNLDLIFKVRLLKNKKPEQIKIPATGGEMRPAEEYGEFEFEVGGRKVSLHVYKMLGDDSDELFLPFTDATCVKSSYQGGRYIDLRENRSGVYMLDFNYAYNPYCAYNHNYSCPIVPQENHLDVAVTAGEMKY